MFLRLLHLSIQCFVLGVAVYGMSTLVYAQSASSLPEQIFGEIKPVAGQSETVPHHFSNHHIQGSQTPDHTGNHAMPPDFVDVPMMEAPQAVPAPSNYVLGVGDVLRLVVFGEDGLTNKYQVGPEGTISVPLIGDVDVKGLTGNQVAEIVTNRLRDGYLVDPSVSVEISTLRPFFILGEVKTPGSYTYIPDMTVLNAVAIAGGYTYRANQESVDVLIQKGDGQEKKEEISVGTKIGPGDIIFVKERFF